MELPADEFEEDVSDLPAVTEKKHFRLFRALHAEERSGQAIVEFAFATIIFLMTVFGTVDFGRAIYEYQELHNAVREGARVGKIDPSNEYLIDDTVLDAAGVRPGRDGGLQMLSGDISVNCTAGCYPGCGDVTVSAQAYFTPITWKLLGISRDDLPIIMHSSATVTTE
jgi:hypothetical protein